MYYTNLYGSQYVVKCYKYVHYTQNTDIPMPNKALK